MAPEITNTTTRSEHIPVILRRDLEEHRRDPKVRARLARIRERTSHVGRGPRRYQTPR